MPARFPTLRSSIAGIPVVELVREFGTPLFVYDEEAIVERIREFGVMRAMGLQPRRLVAMVLLESLLLTMVGTAAGLALGWQLVACFRERGLDLAWFAEGLRAYGIGTAIRTTLDVTDLMWPVVIATITAFVAGLAPALRAVRLRPAEALRHT